tara:strand:- start:26 stop:1009 length:984 start_codon:yes stop_codon:yes gene_type:complete
MPQLDGGLLAEIERKRRERDARTGQNFSRQPQGYGKDPSQWYMEGQGYTQPPSYAGLIDRPMTSPQRPQMKTMEDVAGQRPSKQNIGLLDDAKQGLVNAQNWMRGANPEVQAREADAAAALQKHFPDSPQMQAVMMAQFANENQSFNPQAVENLGDRSDSTHLGVGLMQFTDLGIGHPKDADGNKNGEYQQRAFVKWLADNGRNMDADSTVEYIKQLITADSTWAKKYHNLGAGNRAKGRKLLRDGASVDELSDFITDKVVGPFTRGSTARQGEMAERREEASTRFARNPPGLLQEAQQYWDREGLVGGLTPRRTQQAAPPPQNLGL